MLGKIKIFILALDHLPENGFIGVLKKRCSVQTFFFTNPYAAIPYSGTLFWEAANCYRLQFKTVSLPEAVETGKPEGVIYIF